MNKVIDHTVPQHHLSEEALLGYASGALDEAASVLVATHLALCPECRAKVEQFEMIGGSVIEELKPAAMSEDALDRVMVALNAPVGDEELIDLKVASAPAFDSSTLSTIPQPLRSYLSADLDALPWKSRGRGVKEARIDIGDGSVRASLLRIRPGETMPQHTHDGVESTIVLKGAFSDETGRYARGDVAIATADHDHAPVADASEECICFAVIDGPLRLTGPIGRVLNLFVTP